MSSSSSSAGPFHVPYLPQNKFKDELIATAKAIVTSGKGILAADESTGTIGTRLQEINLENLREHRREYRRILFTTPNLNQYISGVILFEETLYEKTEDGKTDLVAYLKNQGVILGIKVDQGTKPLPGCNDETYTQGLTDLDKRCEKYYKAGCRFAKWRAVLRISRGTPSPLSIKENAESLARYATICQANGLVPIVEPEILMDGDHDISVCQYWTEKVLAACYKALNDYHVILEGTLLKPNMVLPGKSSKQKAEPVSVARATVQALQRTVPPSVAGVVFLSGGLSEEDASIYLNAINALDLGRRPWALTFSYGRALQKSAIKAWKGKKENVQAAQQAFFSRARANGLAAKGQYKGDAATSASSESIYVANYKY